MKKHVKMRSILHTQVYLTKDSSRINLWFKNWSIQIFVTKVCICQDSCLFYFDMSKYLKRSIDQEHKYINLAASRMSTKSFEKFVPAT